MVLGGGERGRGGGGGEEDMGRRDGGGGGGRSLSEISAQTTGKVYVTGPRWPATNVLKAKITNWNSVSG